MALNIISNFAANLAHRNLVISDREATSSLAKISAGKRVLSAKDDAASLAIGSRLRAEIQAMKQANNNAGQASSMLQIADGALDTIAEILIRMKTLAVQSSSGQFSTTERSVLDSEFQALSSEITRISQDTEFSGTKLIAGSSINTIVTSSALAGIGLANVQFLPGIHPVSGDVYTITYNAEDNVLSFKVGNGDNEGINDLGDAEATLDVEAINALAAGEALRVTLTNGITVEILDTFDTEADIKYGTVTNDIASENSVVTSLTVAFSAVSPSDFSPDLFTKLQAISSGADGNGASYDPTTGILRLAVTSTATENGLLIHGIDLEVEITLGASEVGADATAVTATGGVNLQIGGVTLGTIALSAIVSATGVEKKGFIDVKIGQGLVSNELGEGVNTVFTYKVGTGTETYDDLSFSIASASAEKLGVLGTAEKGDVSIATAEESNTASGLISAAITTLSAQRSVIGAAQNRLSFASNNLAIAIENAEAARSSLLDLDIAAEMTVFTSRQILVQVGVSMLAQANQIPQNLLRLFQ